MSIGVIIPTFNRIQNLRLVLESLAQQTVSDFPVVVADDGSTDGTRHAIELMTREPVWQGRLRWVGCGPNLGGRRGRTRNIGAANLRADCTFMVMLDSDSLLEEHAIEHYAALQRRHPQVVIMGRTDWLPPLETPEIGKILKKQGMAALRLQVPEGMPQRVEGTFVGTELRQELRRDLFDGREQLLPLQPEWSLPLNSGYPLDIFWALGGFDEGMVGYGYEDIELGVRANQRRVQVLPTSDIWSLHIWHAKAHSELCYLENQRNLDYVLRKHGPNRVLEREVDWAHWWHYHRSRGGRILRVGSQMWVVNHNATFKIRIDGDEWVERLGFPANDHVLPDAESQLEQAADAGVISETSLDLNSGRQC